jgi:hypothetical protein
LLALQSARANMSSANIPGPLSAYTEQSSAVPKSVSEEVPFPQELWAVIILSVILFVLLAWKAIDEMVDSSGDDDSTINRHPPY